jgi:hypothetical protein
MREIIDEKIKKIDSKYHVNCLGCGRLVVFATKAGALKLIKRGNCRKCMTHYTAIKSDGTNIYQNEIGKWCSRCSGCGKEQAYTRKDHAKQSEVSDWQCKQCVADAKRFSENQPVGDKTRLYRKFKKAAANRGIEFTLNEEQFYEDYDGICSLTGWEISIAYSEQTASVDRVDNSKGYTQGNIQWVHVMVNMCRNKYELDKFIEMCKAVTNRQKTLSHTTKGM